MRAAAIRAAAVRAAALVVILCANNASGYIDKNYWLWPGKVSKGPHNLAAFNKSWEDDDYIYPPEGDPIKKFKPRWPLSMFFKQLYNNTPTEAPPEPEFWKEGAWIDENGTVPVLRAEQDNDGLWNWPEGSVVPKDPNMMPRIVVMQNQEFERFYCLLPGRDRPPFANWMDIPQVPVVEDVDIDFAEMALRPIEGKCFHRREAYWTYEFCYKSHVRQYRWDPIAQKITDSHMLGYYNKSAPFELLHMPDNIKWTQDLDVEGPAWTSSLNTVYGNGEDAEPLGLWYSAEYRNWFMSKNFTLFRPRQVAVRFQCLQMHFENEIGTRMWLDRANVYLDKDRIPFDIFIEEPRAGLYEVVIKSEALCERDSPIYQETDVELSAEGSPLHDITCQSEKDGQVYELWEVPMQEGYEHEWKEAYHPWDDGEEDLDN
mmetsp:Transcript_50733/g.123659  ORF Transcript_50733/g.123659 Transcript_50733/m.123659 type:complete len:429 (+) Transcript_50733:125-1411(+)